MLQKEETFYNANFIDRYNEILKQTLNGRCSVNYSYVINKKKRTCRPNAACFSSIFADLENNRVKNDIKLTITLYDEYTNGNWNVFSRNEIKEFLNDIKKIVDFKYRSKKTQDGIVLYIETKKLNFVQHKFLLTALRYLFELPYSFNLFLTKYILKKKILKTNTFNLLNIIDELTCTCDNHSLFYYNFQFLEINDFKKTLLKSRKKNLQAVFGEQDYMKIKAFISFCENLFPPWNVFGDQILINEEEDLYKVIDSIKKVFQLFKNINKDISSEEFKKTIKEINKKQNKE